MTRNADELRAGWMELRASAKGLHGLELATDLVEQVAWKHLVVERSLVRVREPEIPAGEDELLEWRKIEDRRDVLGDTRVRLLRDHAQARYESALHELDARDQGGGDRSVDTDDDDSQFAHGSLFDWSASFRT